MIKKLFAAIAIASVTFISTPAFAEVKETCKAGVMYEKTEDLSFCFGFNPKYNITFAEESTNEYLAVIKRVSDSMTLYTILDLKTNKITSLITMPIDGELKVLSKNTDWELIKKYELQKQKMFERFDNAIKSFN